MEEERSDGSSVGESESEAEESDVDDDDEEGSDEGSEEIEEELEEEEEEEEEEGKKTTFSSPRYKRRALSQLKQPHNQHTPTKVPKRRKSARNRSRIP